MLMTQMSNLQPGETRPRRLRRDPLRHHRAVVGPDARISWWERARAFLMLIFIVVGLGIALAVFIGASIFLARVLLETLAG